MTFIGFVSFGWIESEHSPKGDPRLLLYTVDYAGNVCGIDNMKYRPLGYPLPSASYVCVDQCPLVTDANKYFCEGDDWKGSSVTDIATKVSNNECMFHVESKKV